MPANNPHDNNAAVLITGAGRNVGAYMAWRFLEADYPVVAHYRRLTDEVEALAAADARIVQGDFDGPTSIQAIAADVRAATPRLRAIIHNASSFAPTAAAADTAAEQFQQFYNVHMLAPFLLNRALADCLIGRAHEPADIVHITDIYADNPAVEYDAYCATKAGLQNLALSAAKRLAPAVKVNVVQPGPIDFQDWHQQEQRQQVLATTPLAQAGGPAAIFIAIQAILDNPFQTGAVIAVDGGRRLGRK